MQFAFHRDVALGRYVPGDGPVHRLDPRTKLVAFLAVLAGLFVGGPAATGALVALLVAAAAAAGLPARRVLGGLSALSWILLVTFVYQALWVGPRHLGGVAEGALAGVWMALRLAGMLLAALLLTATTEPVRLADGLAGTFSFLERFRVPVRDLALVVTLALRFLPAVMEEAQRIATAQRARGARFGGGPLARARGLLPLAIPLFAGCLQRADTLALAMEARGYRAGVRRTQLEPLAFRAADGWTIAAVALILMAVAGAGR